MGNETRRCVPRQSEWLGEYCIKPFNNYLRESIRNNVPFDQFVRELGSGSGEATKDGTANYVRLYKQGGARNWHTNIGEAVAQTFLGCRIQCARCHDHPKDRWTQDDYFGLANVFAKVKATRPDGKLDGPETVIVDHGLHVVRHPKLGQVPTRTVDGVELATSAVRGTLWESSQWIWNVADAAKDAAANVPLYFRRTIELKAIPVAERIYSTADNRMTLYVNSRKIGTDGTWTNIQQQNLTGLLTVGNNVIAIEAVNNGGPASLLAPGQIVQSGRDSTFIGTDAEWKVTKTVAENWTATEFDDSKWAAAVAQGPATMEPWKLQRRASTACKSDLLCTDHGFETTWHAGANPCSNDE